MRYVIGGLLLVIAILAGWWLIQKEQPGAPIEAQTSDPKLAPEVEEILGSKIELFRALMADPLIVSAVEASNMNNVARSDAEIQKLDREWQDAKSVTPFISQFMTNATAQQLLKFQQDHPEFKEIFIADAHGLNMAQTDKTSDYYQADEAWWQQGFNEGLGKTLHGKIEFDESSQTEAISVYVPIMQGNSAIGVVKGVVNLSAISGEL